MLLDTVCPEQKVIHTTCPACECRIKDKVRAHATVQAEQHKDATRCAAQQLRGHARTKEAIQMQCTCSAMVRMYCVQDTLQRQLEERLGARMQQQSR